MNLMKQKKTNTKNQIRERKLQTPNSLPLLNGDKNVMKNKNPNSISKFLISILLTALLSFAACLYFPWWSIAISAFIVAVLLPQTPGRSFLSGFFAIFILWAGLCLFISFKNHHILTHKISLLIIKIDNPILIIILTALIGAIVAGFSALTAAYLRKKREITVLPSLEREPVKLNS